MDARLVWNALPGGLDEAIPMDNEEEKGGNNVCKGLQMYVDEEKMISMIQVDKSHEFSKEIVVSDILRWFKDLDEKAAKDFVEKYWDSEEVNR